MLEKREVYIEAELLNFYERIEEIYKKVDMNCHRLQYEFRHFHHFF